MQRDYETKYHNLESTLWWFRAHREFVLAIVRQAPKDARIFEIGCASGLIQETLAKEGYHDVEGIDISSHAIRVARARGILNVREGRGEATGVADDSIDILIAADILEHIADEKAALAEWHRILKPKGTLIIMVPAFMALWSGHDLANEHKRRYRKPQLLSLLSAAGFDVQKSSYWNFTLFLPTALYRIIAKLTQKELKPEAQLFGLPKSINAILLGLLRAENTLLRLGLRFPFGVSVWAIAHKKKIS
jgi:2-polyprenyl-3-methyl-5-hydroxy-6-metoxy-1,4-benzoquinol methylase